VGDIVRKFNYPNELSYNTDIGLYKQTPFQAVVSFITGFLFYFLFFFIDLLQFILIFRGTYILVVNASKGITFFTDLSCLLLWSVRKLLGKLKDIILVKIFHVTIREVEQLPSLIEEEEKEEEKVEEGKTLSERAKSPPLGILHVLPSNDNNNSSSSSSFFLSPSPVVEDECLPFLGKQTYDFSDNNEVLRYVAN
jgi:hypothetical protein